ncbi:MULTISPECIES: antibiotic biosynthesis monooxygenase [unclassified Pseudarthrobacter]|uniref:antibiotic biosynthesis monooxygenase n=1 Tax=unclassified Pseudarthrobacter TaxID=2647000 RepID=UPI00249BBDC9|nr:MULTISPECIES: antibiotic biosynthesis monooxygenase [unclassified Pseudarthrobacter]MDI3195274.1 antibiotic biosynthesis monooxygenase [Pseudarthrobacter sp. AL20]MDI3209340.1 antibiotic biosynthesis monooxygenase [Pseudarthrobacter sp. AL07]
MFARVSTYKTGPETVSDTPTEDIVSRVRQIPGCKGIYYLSGKETDKAISITLWDTEEAMTASRQEANKIRKENSDEEKTEIVAVEEFEVTVSSLND